MKVRVLLKAISVQEWVRIVMFSSLLFGIFGTVTALWGNNFFFRMAGVRLSDYILLLFESFFLAFYLSLKTASCATKKAGMGSVFGFLGFACPVCNKILMLLFGATFLLTYFEPIRLYVGLLGIVLLIIAIYQKLLIKMKCAVSYDKTM